MAVLICRGDDLRLFGSVKNLADKTYISSRAPEGIFSGMGRTLPLGECRFLTVLPVGPYGLPPATAGGFFCATGAAIAA